MKGKDVRFVYRIDRDDTITFVSPEWLAFAEENGTPQLNRSRTVGRSLWDFVSGEEVRHLYQLVFRGVRRENKAVVLPFRCDSPDLRRFMELTISALPEEGVELEGKLLKKEPRPQVPAWSSSAEAGEALVSMCSWCKRIKVSRDEWWEIEKAIAEMWLFDSVEAPRITHGACPVCEVVVMREIKALGAGGGGLNSAPA